jgi:hypothetical protein
MEVLLFRQKYSNSADCEMDYSDLARFKRPIVDQSTKLIKH